MKQKDFFIWIGVLSLIVAIGVSGCCPRAGSAAGPKASIRTVGRSKGCDCNEYTKSGRNYNSFTFAAGGRCDGLLHVSKEGPAEVLINKEFVYTINLQNMTECELENVVVTEKNLKNVRIIKTDPVATKKMSDSMMWQYDTIGPNGSELIEVTAIAERAGSLRDCTLVTFDPVVCLSANVIQPALKLALTAASSRSICDTIPLRLVVSNPGASPAKNVRVTTTLPSGLTTASGKSQISTSIPSLAAGESREIAENLKASKQGNFSISSIAQAEPELTAKDSASTSVWQAALQVGISGPKSMLIGTNGTYQITVKSIGGGACEDAVLEAIIPADMSFVSATDGGQYTRGKVSWNIGDLAQNKTDSVSMKLKALDAGVNELTAIAKGSCCKQASDSIKTEATGIPAILLEVIDTNDPVEVGGTTSYVITVTNQGSAVDANIRLTAKLEDNMQYVSSTGTTTAQVKDRSIVFDAVNTLAPQKRASWEITVKALKAGDVRFAVEMQSKELERPVAETEATRIY